MNLKFPWNFFISYGKLLHSQGIRNITWEILYSDKYYNRKILFPMDKK